MAIGKHSVGFCCCMLLYIFSLCGMIHPAYSKSDDRRLEEDVIGVLDLSTLLEKTHAEVTNAALNKFRQEERPDILAHFRQNHGPFFEHHISSIVRAFPGAFSSEELSRIVQAEKSGDLTELGQELSAKLVKKMEKVNMSVGGLTSLYIRQANEGEWEEYSDANQGLCVVFMTVGTQRKWVDGELIDAPPLIETVSLSYQKDIGYGAGFTVNEENLDNFPENADVVIAVGGLTFVVQRHHQREHRKLLYGVSADDAKTLWQRTNNYEYIFVYKRHKSSDSEYLARVGTQYDQNDAGSIHTALGKCIRNMR